MSYRLAITKTNFNVLTETSINNFVFHSDYNTLKYYVSGSVQITVNNGGGKYNSNTSIAHNLGYYPFFVAYAIDNNFMPNYAPTGIYITPTGLSYRFFQTAVNTSNIYFVAMGNSLAGDSYVVTFKYKIYKNNLNL